jgi:hypothetical protein
MSAQEICLASPLGGGLCLPSNHGTKRSELSILTRYFGLCAFSTFYGFIWTSYSAAGAIGPVITAAIALTTAQAVAALSLARLDTTGNDKNASGVETVHAAPSGSD